jgi:hypothetical protein
MKVRRGMLLIGAEIVFVVGIILSMMVLPQVAIDPYPGATPGNAIPTLLFVVIANVLIGVVLLVAFLRWSVGSVLLGLVGFGAIVLGLMLLSGAFAYNTYGGPSRNGVTIALFVCVGADLVAGVLALIASLLGVVLAARVRKREARGAT